MKNFIGIRIVETGENTLAPYIEYEEDGVPNICEYASIAGEEAMDNNPSHYGREMLARVSRALELERDELERDEKEEERWRVIVDNYSPMRVMVGEFEKAIAEAMAAQINARYEKIRATIQKAEAKND